jgi:uncharacterized protein
MADENTQNNIVWADIPVTDLDRACAFYAAVLGRKVEQHTFEGMTFAVFEHTGGNGACLVKSGAPSSTGPLMYLNVQGRLDAAEAEVAKHGGQVLIPKHVIGPHGFRSVILDSEGNRVALHSM